MVTLKMFWTTAQYLFFRVFLRRSSVSLIIGYYIQSSFGFQKGHSTDHAIVHLVDQIYDSFENDNYTLGVFIDTSKAFDTVDHSILLKN